MIAYKAFEHGLICRGYRFSMGLNRTEKANCRENGFHCAENPLDCLTYYSDMDRAEYYVVDAGGDIDEDEYDTKISCTELTVLKKLTKWDFFLHSLAFMADHPLREWNRHVSRGRAEASHGYAVVRGSNPAACGKCGDILALAEEDPVNGRIIRVGLAQVDGGRIREGTWYGADMEERQVALI